MTPKDTTPENTVSARFQELRKSQTVALHIAAELLRHREEGNYLDEDEEYQMTLELVATLAKGLHEGVSR